MCLAFVLVEQVPDIPLIILFNRDEDFERPTAPADYWKEQPEILAGRDLVRGGTWGGISTTGRIAFLTNVGEPHPAAPSPRSRGNLVRNFLAGETSAEEYIWSIQPTEEYYYGFNLVVGDPGRLLHYSNRSKVSTRLRAGIHGLSNADLNTPWPKVVRGKCEIANLIADRTPTVQELFEVMLDNTSPRHPTPGRHRDGFRDRDTIFVRLADWGTRLTSVLLFHVSGEVRFEERTYAIDKSIIDQRVYRFRL